MSYYTRFQLTIHEGEIFTKKGEHIIEKFEAPFFYDRNPFLFTGWTEDSCSWYNWREEMEEWSKNYPETTFLLHGEGEDNEDLWNCYFKNGKSQKCEAIITYEEYDESKLK